MSTERRLHFPCISIHTLHSDKSAPIPSGLDQLTIVMKLRSIAPMQEELIVVTCLIETLFDLHV